MHDLTPAAPEGYLDIYCERRAPGLWAEPLNTLTNTAFLVAAVLLWREFARSGRFPAGLRLLLALVLAIAVGSSTFHAFAVVWARVLDEVPILLFQLVYLWLYLRRVAGWSRLAAAGALAAYLAFAIHMRGYSQIWNGSLVYAPALALTIALAAYHALQRLPHRLGIAYAAAALSLGVGARTLDAALCDVWPIGTHFLWHMLVALALYCSLRALHAAMPRAAPPLA